jgi:hypothetical protein
VPSIGMYPEVLGEMNLLCQPGPICRSARDLWPLLNVLTGPTDNAEQNQNLFLTEPLWRSQPHFTPDSVDIDKLTFYYVKDTSHPRVRQFCFLLLCGSVFLI